MIIPSVPRVHTPEPGVPAQTRPELLLEVQGATAREVAPFLVEEHFLALPPGTSRPVWHDSTSWRIGVPGWGEHYAAHVVEWPALDTLSLESCYVLTAQEEEGRGPVVRLSPA